MNFFFSGDFDRGLFGFFLLHSLGEDRAVPRGEDQPRGESGGGNDQPRAGKASRKDCKAGRTNRKIPTDS